MNDYSVGDQVEIRLDAKFGERAGWYRGVVIRIDPYSQHRNFIWVRLDEESQSLLNTHEISVFNPKNIRKANQI